MRRRILSIIFATMLAVGSVGGANPSWEVLDVANPQIAVTESIVPQGQVEIMVKGDYVYLYTAKPVQVKVFSILGQLIAQSNLPAGTHRLKLSTRGIYILRAGNVTQRITI